MLNNFWHFCVTKPVNAPYGRHFDSWLHVSGLMEPHDFVHFNFLSETCRYSPAGTSLLNLFLILWQLAAIKVPTGCGSAQFRPVSRTLVLPSWSIQLWKQISTHAPYSHNMPSVPDCHPVHLLVPCYDTCHRLAVQQPVVNQDEVCYVRTSLLTRWREKELGWFRDTTAACGF